MLKVVSTQLDEVISSEDSVTMRELFLSIVSKIVGIPFPCVTSFKSYLT